MDKIETTLSKEKKKMEKAVEEKIENFRLPEGDTENSVVQILRSSSRSNIEKKELDKMQETVENRISKDSPIPITLKWAYSYNAENSYKFLDPVNMPRAGDIWALYYFEMIGKKIQQVYSPGCKWKIIDELPIEKMLRPENEIFQRKKAIENNIDIGCIEFFDLPNFNIKDMEVSEPKNSEILAILTSTDLIGRELIEEISENLYVKNGREKDWNAIKKKVPAVKWEKAKELKRDMKKVSKKSKKENGFIDQITNGKHFIDACLTEKGRYTPDPWNMAFPQHGGTLLKDDPEKGQYSVKIEPEAELKDQNLVQVQIKSSEFQVENDKNYTFYWRKRG